MPNTDLALEGGGVKGLGLVGAVLRLRREGHVFPRIAGTSAGSTVAALLAAGATADELSSITSTASSPRSHAGGCCDCRGTPRCSTSISTPLFFEPVTVRDGRTGERRFLVDGGVLSNFPTEIFDRTDAVRPRWPTLGVKMIPDLPAGNAQLFQVDTSNVGIVEFGADERKREALVANGERAARQFLAAWDWKRFKQACRGAGASQVAGTAGLGEP